MILEVSPYPRELRLDLDASGFQDIGRSQPTSLKNLRGVNRARRDNYLPLCLDRLSHV